ncbi:MAG TPA: TniB family NTP-binding protein [Thiobacillus sp.]|nr:MAG: transposase [Hydrogenophilales bacterium 28-61-11]OYZ58545.1 MAG: transposase [Hydrogenophilales bacterium 16-61-112]OZA50430.1 MAG: transposase [Hydrogenophilales bacterium 17-61-76]HQT29610.1 TniB family NTP-binding protein [Thiobacillus sp.]HQT70254.1 TniB family NTP-binding protein [Thiobacillus sp.]
MNSNDAYGALKRFDEEYIPFPPFIAAANSIDANIAQYRETGLAQHLLVLGESGTGKSSLCRWVGEKYPRSVLLDRDLVPSLIVAVPPAATIASVAEAMLARLGDPSPSTGSISAKTARVITLCRGCRVEMVLFDEAQHIHDRGQVATHYMVGDWLKNLIDEMGVPTVFLGLPRLENLLQVNEQLRRRFSRRLRLALGQSDTETIDTECLQLFVTLGSCLPLRLSTGDYSWPELGRRLYFASDGRVAYIKRLLAGALRHAMETDAEQIGPTQLERVFTEEIWWEGIGALNPFNTEFKFRRLDRGNEPFERGSYKTPARGKSSC